MSEGGGRCCDGLAQGGDSEVLHVTNVLTHLKEDFLNIVSVSVTDT